MTNHWLPTPQNPGPAIWWRPHGMDYYTDPYAFTRYDNAHDAARHARLIGLELVLSSDGVVTRAIDHLPPRDPNWVPSRDLCKAFSPVAFDRQLR